MSHLFTLNETFTNGMNYNVLNIISITSILSGICVISSKNPIVSVLFLIGLFFSVAGYLMMLGINFIGLSYLLVYVGAVSILFIFILMLINIRVSELSSNSSNSVPLGVIIGVFFNLIVYELLPAGLGGSTYASETPKEGLSSYDSNLIGNLITIGKQIISISSLVAHNSEGGYQNVSLANVYFVTSQSWDGVLCEASHITSIGNIIYTNYPLWLILASLILLLAMVGAIVITIKSK